MALFFYQFTPLYGHNPRAELKVEQKQRKMKKCSTAKSKIVPRGAESRTKTEKNEKMFYRGVQNRAVRS